MPEPVASAEAAADATPAAAVEAEKKFEEKAEGEEVEKEEGEEADPRATEKSPASKDPSPKTSKASAPEAGSDEKLELTQTRRAFQMVIENLSKAPGVYLKFWRALVQGIDAENENGERAYLVLALSLLESITEKLDALLKLKSSEEARSAKEELSCLFALAVPILMHDLALKWTFTFEKSKLCPDYAARWYDLFENCFGATLSALVSEGEEEDDEEEQDTNLLSCCAQVVVALCLQKPQYTEFFIPLLVSIDGDGDASGEDAVSQFYTNRTVWTILEKIVPAVPQDNEPVRDSIVDSVLQVAGAVVTLPVAEKFSVKEKKLYAGCLDVMGNCLLAVAKNHGSAFKATLSSMDPYETGTLQKILRSKLA